MNSTHSSHPHAQHVSKLIELAGSVMTVQILRIAADLNIADHLKEGPQTAQELASLTETHPEALARMLRTLANQGIFQELEDGRFAQNDCSHLLCSDDPFSMKEYFSSSFSPISWQSIGATEHSIKTGEPCFEKVAGVNLWAFLGQNPELAMKFGMSMTGMSNFNNQILSTHYDFSALRTIADIGGAMGSLLLAILEKNEHLTGVLFDQPPVIQGAQSILAQHPLYERIAFEAGDFFDRVPGSVDAYILRYVLHDWDDEKSIQILNTCRKSNPKARVLLFEQMLKPQNTPAFTHIMDLYMLTLFGSKERTEADYCRLLEHAGYSVQRVIETPTPLNIIEAFPKE